jgi:hypothetical protein
MLNPLAHMRGRADMSAEPRAQSAQLSLAFGALADATAIARE